MKKMTLLPQQNVLLILAQRTGIVVVTIPVVATIVVVTIFTGVTKVSQQFWFADASKTFCWGNKVIFSVQQTATLLNDKQRPLEPSHQMKLIKIIIASTLGLDVIIMSSTKNAANAC